VKKEKTGALRPLADEEGEAVGQRFHGDALLERGEVLGAGDGGRNGEKQRNSAKKWQRAEFHETSTTFGRNAGRIV